MEGESVLLIFASIIPGTICTPRMMKIEERKEEKKGRRKEEGRKE